MHASEVTAGTFLATRLPNTAKPAIQSLADAGANRREHGKRNLESERRIFTLQGGTRLADFKLDSVTAAVNPSCGHYPAPEAASPPEARRSGASEGPKCSDAVELPLGSDRLNLVTLFSIEDCRQAGMRCTLLAAEASGRVDAQLLINPPRERASPDHEAKMHRQNECAMLVSFMFLPIHDSV